MNFDKLLIENIPITPSVGYARLQFVGDKIGDYYLKQSIINYINSLFCDGQQLYTPDDKIRAELFESCEKVAPEHLYVVEGLVNYIEQFISHPNQLF